MRKSLRKPLSRSAGSPSSSNAQTGEINGALTLSDRSTTAELARH